MDHPLITSAVVASQWCSTKNFGDKVILPQILSVAPHDREAAVRNFSEASNMMDADNWEERMEPFMVKFKFQSDYVMFYEECKCVPLLKNTVKFSGEKFRKKKIKMKIDVA